MGRIVVSLPCAASAERGIIAETHTQEEAVATWVDWRAGIRDGLSGFLTRGLAGSREDLPKA